MKRKRKVLADNRGSTLVESVCGLVILALVLVTMYSAFVVAQKILREGDIREKNGQAAFEAIEKQETDQEEELRLTLPIGGNSVSFSGRVVTAGETGRARGCTASSRSPSLSRRACATITSTGSRSCGR